MTQNFQPVVNTERVSPDSTTLPAKKSTLALWFLVFILVAGTALRLYQLNAGLWLDEILTYVNYANMPYGQIVTTFDSENQHFIYSLLAHTAFLLFGESAWSVRLPAVLFGVGSIGALYLLGKRVANTREALLAAALLAFSYHHVWFSQNARGYTGLLFWTLLSSWLLVWSMEDKRLWIILGYAAAAALGVYTHLTMVFVIVGQFIVYLMYVLFARRLNSPASWKNLFIGFGMAGVLILLLHAPVLTQMLSTIGGSQASVVEEWKNPIWTLLELVEGLKIGFSLWIVGLVALVLFGAGLWSYWKKMPAVVGLLLIPPILGAVVTIAIGHHLWPRFFFFAFGFAALVVIRGTMIFGDTLARILRIPDEKAPWLGTLACIGLIAVSLVSVPLAYGPKQDYIGAMNYIDTNFISGDGIATVSLTTFPYQEYLKKDWNPINSLKELNDLRAVAQRTWLVYTFPPVLEAVHPDIMDSIRQDFTLQQSFPGSVGEGTILVVRADRPPLDANASGVLP